MDILQLPISLRLLGKADWPTFKTIRLEALRQEPGFFGSSYALELRRSDNDWQERLTQPGSAYFGLFIAETTCIGLTGVVQNRHDSRVGLLIASYIQPDYRGRGWATLFYRARIDWSRQQGFRKLVVSHRADNAPSKAANQRVGFTYTHSEQQTWPDGNQTDNVFYELVL
jgi:RimJ/RimL family protein N-acetyltransferase